MKCPLPCFCDKKQTWLVFSSGWQDAEELWRKQYLSHSWILSFHSFPPSLHPPFQVLRYCWESCRQWWTLELLSLRRTLQQEQRFLRRNGRGPCWADKKLKYQSSVGVFFSGEKTTKETKVIWTKRLKSNNNKAGLLQGRKHENGSCVHAIVIQIIFRSFDWLGVITSTVEPWLTAIWVGRCSGG